MITSNMECRDNKVEISLEGVLTVQCAAEFRNILIKAFDSGDHVILNISECTGADLSCLQLICSAHRTASKKNKMMELGGTLPDIIAQTAEDAGYFSCRVCRLDAGHACLLDKEVNHIEKNNDRR